MRGLLKVNSHWTNRTDAVRILTDKIRGSIAAAADVTSIWARAATASGNALSDFFDRVGRGADRLVAGGSGIDEKITNLTIRLLELQKAQMQAPKDSFIAALKGIDLDDIRREITSVTAQIEQPRQRKLALDSTPSQDTRDRQRGLEIEAIARATLPAAENTRRLRDETAALNEAFSNPAIGKWVSLVGGDLERALKRKSAAEQASKGYDPVASQIADAEAQIAAIDQRSIAARARFAREAEARRQANDPNAGTDAERLIKQDQAARLAAGGQTALDAARMTRIGTLGALPEADEKPNVAKRESRDDRCKCRLPKAA